MVCCMPIYGYNHRENIIPLIALIRLGSCVLPLLLKSIKLGVSSVCLSSVSSLIAAICQINTLQFLILRMACGHPASAFRVRYKRRAPAVQARTKDCQRKMGEKRIGSELLHTRLISRKSKITCTAAGSKRKLRRLPMSAPGWPGTFKILKTVKGTEPLRYGFEYGARKLSRSETKPPRCSQNRSIR